MTTIGVLPGDPAGKTTGRVTGPPGSPERVSVLVPEEMSSPTPAATPGVIVVVKIRGWPYGAGLAELRSDVTVDAGLTVTPTVAVEMECVVSPLYLTVKACTPAERGTVLSENELLCAVTVPLPICVVPSSTV